MKLNLKQGVIYLALAFVAVMIWSDPRGASDTIGPFLGDVGRFFATILDKGSDFVSGLGD